MSPSYTCHHSDLLDALEEYTSAVYQINYALDVYCDPAKDVYMNPEWLQRHTMDSSFLTRKRWSWRTYAQQVIPRLRKPSKRVYKYAQQMLSMFQSDLPRMKLRLYRCLFLTEENRDVLGAASFDTYRFVSTSLAPAWLTCPRNTVEWDCPVA